MKLIKNTAIILVVLISSTVALAQEAPKTTKRFHPFVAYEFGEAVFNRFQSISGEFGMRFNNNHMMRLVHMNVNLAEKHLSSSFAQAVDGPNVKGKMLGLEAFYDFPVFFKGFYISPSLGYYQNEYSHTILNESHKNTTLTVGAAISYRDTDIFKIKGLYATFSVPFRFQLSPSEKTMLGNTTLRNGIFDNNIWLFIGYEF